MIRKGIKDSLKNAGHKARQVLMWLRNRNIPAHPINYAVVYEYLSERSSKLHAELSNLEKQDRIITNEDLLKLFDQYIEPKPKFDSDSPEHQQRFAETNRVLAYIVKDVLKATLQSADDLAVYKQQLHEFSSQIKDTSSMPSTTLVEELFQYSNITRKKMRQLEWMFNNFSQELIALDADYNAVKESLFLDELTGMYNRRGLNKAFGDFLANKENLLPATLISIDLDDFKSFNKVHGRDRGDKALKGIANYLKGIFDKSGFISRYRGEEFIVLLVKCDLQKAKELSSRIEDEASDLKVIQEGAVAENQKLKLTTKAVPYKSELAVDQWISRLDNDRN